jgi:glycerophosphoryl diester phosphodiesterase
LTGSGRRSLPGPTSSNSTFIPPPTAISSCFTIWTVDCRTNGTGVTRRQTLVYLKSLDIGHGYTADGGKTFPFRGKGIGLMPTLREVLAAFPDRRFLINIKSDDPEEGRRACPHASMAPSGPTASIA